MRDRCAEDGHDGVADELLHDAAELLDAVLRGRVVALERVADVLGIGAVGARREALEVDEEHRDELALLARAGVVEPCTAGVAEARMGGVRLAAALARDLQRVRGRRHPWSVPGQASMGTCPGCAATLSSQARIAG